MYFRCLAVLLALVCADNVLAKQRSVNSPPVVMSFGDQKATNSPVVLTSLQESDFEEAGEELLKRDEADDRSGLQLESPESLDDSRQGDPRQSSQSLSSDQPIKSPVLNLEDDQESPSNDKPQSAGQEAGSELNYQLPSVANVQTPISSMPLTGLTQYDPGGLLNSEQQLNGVYADRATRYSDLSGAAESTKVATWKAHNFYHRPTLFEDRNLERYGNQRGNQRSNRPAVQNLASAAHFLKGVPTVPYQVGQQPPNSRVYTHGLGRPGDCVPYQTQIPSRVDRKGAALQAIVTLGIILP